MANTFSPAIPSAVHVVDGEITINNASFAVEIDAADGDNIAIKDSTGTNALNVNPDGSIDVNATFVGAEVDQGAPAVVADAWPIKITDGVEIAAVTASNELQVLASAQPGVDIGDVTINNASIPVTQSGTWNINNVSGTVSLPTGASTLAEQQTQTTSLSVIDDWDESDRAKVNPIVGSAGVQGGSGGVSASTQRVVLATDVALPTGTNAIGTVTAVGAAAAGAAPSGNPVQCGFIDATGVIGVPRTLTILGSPVMIQTLIGAASAGFVDSFNSALLVTGDEQHDAPDAGSPHKIGGKAVSARPTAVANNDRANAYFDLVGREVIRMDFDTRADTFTGTGNGTTVDTSTNPLKSFSIQVKGTGASATTWDIRLEGSLDGTNFTQILQHTTADLDGIVKWSGAGLSPSLHFRSRVAALTLGAATNVVVTILGTF